MNIYDQHKLLAIGQLNEKSQLVIPKEARTAIGIGPGDRVVIALAPFANVLVIAKPEELEKQLNAMIAHSEKKAKDIRKDLNDIKNRGVS